MSYVSIQLAMEPLKLIQLGRGSHEGVRESSFNGFKGHQSVVFYSEAKVSNVCEGNSWNFLKANICF